VAKFKGEATADVTVAETTTTAISTSQERAESGRARKLRLNVKVDPRSSVAFVVKLQPHGGLVR